MTVGDNLILREYRQQPFSRFRVLNRRAAAEAANRAISDYRIKTSGRSGKDTQVRLMSGGNQQKVIDQAVRCHRHGLKRPCQLLHGLVVAAVDRQILPAKQRVQRSAGKQLYHVGAAVVGRFHAVLHLRGSFRGQVLVKSSAKHRVHQLMSPADAQHRLVPLHSPAQNVRVHAVPQSGHDRSWSWNTSMDFTARSRWKGSGGTTCAPVVWTLCP